MKINSLFSFFYLIALLLSVAELKAQRSRASLPKKKRKELRSLSLGYDPIDLLSKKEGQFPFEAPKKYEDK